MKPFVIFDTDMDTDCDDAGALALLIQLQKQGKCELGGVIVDAPTAYGAPAAEAITRYYGVDVPIGTIYESEYPEETSSRYRKYRAHRRTLPDEIYYNRTLAQMIGKMDTDYPSAAEVYYELLSKAEDHSVVIAAVGFMTAIEQLWNYKDGYELFRRKTAYVVSMGCADYPETDNYNFNYNMDGYGAEVFFQKCPCDIYVSKEGEDIITGYSFTHKLKEDNPLRIAYEIYNGGPERGRSSWDLVDVLFAVEPQLPIFQLEAHGQVVYCAENNTVHWKEADIRKDHQLTLVIDSKEASVLLEEMITGPQMS